MGRCCEASDRPSRIQLVASFVFRAAALVARVLPSSLRLGLYRLGPITRWLRRTLNRSVLPGIAPVTIAAGDLAGMQLLLDLRVDKDMWLGTYEPFLPPVLRRLIRPGMTAYDLGANIGYVTLLLVKAVGPRGRVVAVEPLPSAVERLRVALELNHVQDQVTLVAKAIGSTNGRQRFLVHPSPGMGRLEISPGRPERFQQVVEVDVVSLDHLVFADGFPIPDLIKIDLEGGEGLALEGMKRLLGDTKPRLLIEVHGRVPADEVWERLTSAGYTLHDLEQGERRLNRRADVRPKAHLLAMAEASR